MTEMLIDCRHSFESDREKFFVVEYEITQNAAGDNVYSFIRHIVYESKERFKQYLNDVYKNGVRSICFGEVEFCLVCNDGEVSLRL